MSDELMFVNAFIGFCKPMAGTWPNSLGSLGYEVVGVEKEIGTIVAGRPRIAVPELICASPVVNHVFWLEAKTTSVSKDQANRYLAITDEQLVISGMLPTGMVQALMAHDTIYAAVSTNALTLVSRISHLGASFPVISGDSSLFQLISGVIGQTVVHDRFGKGVRISPTDQWPRQYVKFNKDVDDALIAQPIMNTLSIFIMGSEDFTTWEIAEQSISHWVWCGSQERNAFVNKIHRIVDRAQREELKPYFRPAQPPKRVRPDPAKPWSPIGTRPMKSNALSALQRAVTTFTTRQLKGTPYKVDQPPLTGLE